MAQSLTVRASIRNATTSGFSGRDSISVNTTGNGEWMRKESVGTTEEQWTISADAIGDAGYCVIRNYDATNYLQVGFATGDYKLRVKAGQVAVLPLEPATSDLFLKANTAAVVASVYVVEA